MSTTANTFKFENFIPEPSLRGIALPIDFLVTTSWIEYRGWGGGGIDTKFDIFKILVDLY